MKGKIEGMGGLIRGVCCKLLRAYMGSRAAPAACFSYVCLVALQGRGGNTKPNVARKAAELRGPNV